MSPQPLDFWRSTPNGHVTGLTRRLTPLPSVARTSRIKPREAGHLYVSRDITMLHLPCSISARAIAALVRVRWLRNWELRLGIRSDAGLSQPAVSGASLQ